MTRKTPNRFILSMSLEDSIFTENKFDNHHGEWYLQGEASKKVLRFLMVVKPRSQALQVKKVNVKVLSQSKDRFVAEEIIEAKEGMPLYQHFFSLKEIKPLDLTLIVEIIVSYPLNAYADPSKSMTPLIAPENSLPAYMKKLMDTEKYWDVKILPKHEGEIMREIKVASFVLARSPVFDEILETAEEAQYELVISVNDFNYKVMQELVRYLYTDEVHNCEEIGLEILEAAVKYELPGLIDMLKNYFKNNISIENFIDVLEKSDQLNLEDLKDAAFDFIINNHVDIVHTADWIEWMNKSRNNTKLGTEALTRCISYFDNTFIKETAV